MSAVECKCIPGHHICSKVEPSTGRPSLEKLNQALEWWRCKNGKKLWLIFENSPISNRTYPDWERFGFSPIEPLEEVYTNRLKQMNLFLRCRPYSFSQLRAIWKFFQHLHGDYRTCLDFSFLLASMISNTEYRGELFVEFLLSYFKDKEVAQQFWSWRVDYFQDGPIPATAPTNTRDRFTIEVWSSLTKNEHFAFPVLKALVCKASYDENRRPIFKPRLADLATTFSHLIQHSDPESVFGHVKLATVLECAGKEDEILEEAGLARMDAVGMGHIGLVSIDYCCECWNKYKSYR